MKVLTSGKATPTDHEWLKCPKAPPPGLPRYTVSIADDDSIADPTAFVSTELFLVYVNLNPTKQCTDEVMEG
jgi:hypothetical protein